jgi:hypothetical protein
LRSFSTAHFGDLVTRDTESVTAELTSHAVNVATD